MGPSFIGRSGASGSSGPSGPPLANMHLWLDGNLGTFEGAADPAEDGDDISTWEDQSGNGFDFSSSGSNEKPILRENTVNGLHVVDFDGLNDRMVHLSDPISAAPMSVYCVFVPHDLTVNGTLFCNVHSGSTGEYFSMWARGLSANDPVGWITRTNPGTNDVVETTTGLTQDQQHIGSAVETSSTQRDVWIDGTSIGSSTASVVPNSINIMAIGTLHQATPTAFFNGYMCELIVYDVAHDTATRQQVETYLQNRWNTPALP